MNKLRKLWLDLNSSLWFIPTIIVLASIALALLLIEADRTIDKDFIAGHPRFFGVEPGGSRDMLAIVAGSMITVAGIVFSITIVALSLASTQYTPRILRNFMRDQVNQVVLGVFVGIFTYCIIVLRTIQGGNDEDRIFVPSIAVIVGVLLALVGIGFLIFFIHHIATSIQASSIVAAISEESYKVIDEMFPYSLGNNATEAERSEVEKQLTSHVWHAIPALSCGYVQNIDIGMLLKFTCERQLIVRMEHGVGEFVVSGTPLASVAQCVSTQHVDNRFDNDDEIIKTLNATYSIDSFRTIDQDIAFGLRQIVDIVMKALSPAVNDTTTAVICVDYLTAILSRLAARRFPSRYRFVAGRLRVIAKRPSFADLIDLAFHQVRQNAGGNVAVILRSLHALEIVARCTQNADETLSPAKRLERQSDIIRHAKMFAETARTSIEFPDDRAHVEEHIARVMKNLEQTSHQYQAKYQTN